MSAFFDWDCRLVQKTILRELVNRGRSIDPSDYEPDADEWADITTIDLPQFNGLEFYTSDWDVNIWDNDGRFTITAYPVYDGKTETSAWITCYEEAV